jgi:hypothetical protein
MVGLIYVEREGGIRSVASAAIRLMKLAEPGLENHKHFP